MEAIEVLPLLVERYEQEHSFIPADHLRSFWQHEGSQTENLLSASC